jgi:hypothetical protein
MAASFIFMYLTLTLSILCTSPYPSPKGEGIPLLLEEKGEGDEVLFQRRRGRGMR